MAKKAASKETVSPRRKVASEHSTTAGGETVVQSQAAPVPLKPTDEVEPTAEQLAAEQTLIDEELQARRAAGRQTPAPGKDLLASYMEQLSQIPLFTPEQELQNARHLET